MFRSLLASFVLVLCCSIVFAEESTDTTQVTDPDPNQALIDEGTQIQAEIKKLVEASIQLRLQIERETGDIKSAFELELQQKTVVTLDLLFDLADVLHQQAALEIDVTKLRDTVVSYIIQTSNGVDNILDTVLQQHSERRSSTESLAGFELVQFERSISSDLEWIETLFDTKMNVIRELDRLGISSTNHRENFLSRLSPFADNLSGQTQLVEREKEAMEATASTGPLSSELSLQLRALLTREQAVLNTLSAIIVHLEENGIDSTRLRQLLLQTGEVNTDLFNPRIMMGLIKKELLEGVDWLRDNSGSFITKIIIFLSILFIFRLIARFTKYLMRKSFDSNRMETSRLMQEMLLSLSTRGIMLLGLLFALGQMGVEITALLTGLGIVGFIVGFALQDALANFAAGIMILGYRPFDVDDVIETGGVIGRVARMSLVSTTVLTFDNQTLIIPNNRIWGDVIRNITLQQQRRIDMEFRVAYDESIVQVKSVITEIITRHEKILKDPSPTVQMDELSPYAMVFVVRPWVEKADYWSVKWELLQTIKERLDAEGIKIPTVNEGVLLAP